jgi:hypothetical protein
MDRKFEGKAAGVVNARADALGEFEMMAVARTQVGASLRNADDRLA